jgi:hypothetical protein
MDINGCKSLFGHHVVAHTTIGKDFVGTLSEISGSAATVELVPLSDDEAARYPFAINGVNAIGVEVIAFMQDLAQPHS